MKLHNNKIALMAMALALTTPVIVAPTTADAAKLFKDVTSKNANFEIIHMMAEKGVISGYPDGTFKPNDTISRKHAAALITRAVKILPKTTTFNAPKDLSTKNAYYHDIKKLMEAGLLELDKKGNINPDAPLTRGEMAKIIAIAYQLDTTGSHPFYDVSMAYNPYVAALYEAGIASGYEDSTFREKTYLTRAHYTAFIYRAMRDAGEIPVEMPDSHGDLFLPTNYTSENYRQFALAHAYITMWNEELPVLPHPLFPGRKIFDEYNMKVVKYLMKTGEKEYYYSRDIAQKINNADTYRMLTASEVEEFLQKHLNLKGAEEGANTYSIFRNSDPTQKRFGITLDRPDGYATINLPKMNAAQQANNIQISSVYNNKDLLNQFLAYIMKENADQVIAWYEKKMKILYNPLYMHQDRQSGYFAKQFGNYLIQFNVSVNGSIDVYKKITGSQAFFDDKLNYNFTITTADQLKIIENAPPRPIEFKQETFDQFMRDVLKMHERTIAPR
ncbi:S-layer homology domain-containing protein [Bacillus ndiopicus]|uniref:S-layer homology domain-containing protein n=1 Tax=Bacillus ndiopicus TaxID=1347368 RepID=UPI0005AA8344|nr:S-layer homology domain-containing protein [Bacillus ndiopicus]